jgi:hypothetical protein
MKFSDGNSPFCRRCDRYQRKPRSGRQPPFDDLVNEAQLAVEPVIEVPARIALEASWFSAGAAATLRY